ncbi:MAG: carnitine dehydratase [Magnetovibrio sp.]|nr:carnitine dehydratase [Magnetovibrio sp.]
MGPLKGLKVVEMTGLGPGPFCTMMLGDMGAEVVRIDRPQSASIEGDPATNINARSRRSVALDLKTSAGREAAARLISQADILIEGFRPGVMERLGLGPEESLAENPKLVYGRMTGWGQDGPLANSAGHDINYLAITGALHAIGPKEAPVPPLNVVADFGGGGMLLLVGVLAAIFEVRISGKGQVVDAGMSDGVPLLLGSVYTRLAQGSWLDQRESNLLDGGAYFYSVYECSDGKFISLGSIEPQFHALLLEKLGLSLDPLFQNQLDPDGWPAAKEKLASVFKTKPRDYWDTVFACTDVCYGPVLSIEEAFEYEHNKARGTFMEIDGNKQASPAPRFSRTPQATPTPPPRPGEHNKEVLSDWGFSSADIQELEEAGAL